MSNHKPVINCLSTSRCVPPSVYMAFRLLVLLESRSGDVSSMLWVARGTLVSWPNCSVGIQSCPTPPCCLAVRPDLTRSWYVRVLDSTDIIYTLEINLSNPKPGHTTGASGRSARRGGGAGSGLTGCQQNCSPRKQASLAPSKASKTRLLVSPEARTSEILCKPMEEQILRLNRG